MTATTPQHVAWQPNPGPQTRFLASRAGEVLYGGSGGSGKSQGLIACPLRWVHNPNYRGLYLRREATYLGDAVDKTRKLYPKLGATLVMSPRIEWRFPSGATVWMGHCKEEGDVANYDSFEFSEILWDELTHFTEKQYLGVNARLRGTDRTLPYWSRAATNPGGTGNDWVFERWGAWLDPESTVRAKPGELLYYEGDELVAAGTPTAVSRTFIPALLADNPHADTPEYRAKLRQLDPVRRAQLEDGNWLARPRPRTYWKRELLQVMDGLPPRSSARVRCWDFGASPTGDWSVGVRMSITPERLVVIEHVVRFRGAPNVVRSTFKATAEADKDLDGRTVQWIPQDPGQAGTDQVVSYQNDHPGIPIRGRRPTGDKLTRFLPLSSKALAGNLAMVRGGWNKAFHDELESIPDHGNDDQMDAASDAHAVLTGGVVPDVSNALAAFAGMSRRGE